MNDATDHPSRTYVTTALAYVNARPHLGHAQEMVLCDAFVRHRRAAGHDVRFLTGSDENSLKNVQAAERESIPTEALVERNAGYFRDLGIALRASFDDFVRTSVGDRHVRAVTKLWNACRDSGDIYRRSYSGLYCVGCEQFYKPEELEGGSCPEHGVPERIEEDNYFFRLSRYQGQILERIESGALRIVPDHRKNEVVSFVRRGLEDFSVSRSRARARGWGVPVPGDPEQVIYVWFDALGGYLSALGSGDGEGHGKGHGEGQDQLFDKYWLKCPNRVHVIGKGILRFHAVYWPAILLSCGVPLPTHLFVHGYLTAEGKKIGKSLGNAVDPLPLVERYGADALRYYLLRHVRPTEDGDFSLQRFLQAYDAELADQLGNLVHRTVSMVHRYFQGVVPRAHLRDRAEEELILAARNAKLQIHEATESFLTDDALRHLFKFVEQANRYVAESAPWKLEGPRLAMVIRTLVQALGFIAVELAPFLPDTASSIAEQIGAPLEALRRAERFSAPLEGTRIPPARVLFPKQRLYAGTHEPTAVMTSHLHKAQP
jgi:methionyl-tRNA synthetase